MDEIEKIIVELAENYKRLNEFIYILEELSVSPNEKGYIFLELGDILYKFFYYSLTLESWERALKYFIQNGDESEKSICYRNFGIVREILGYPKKAIEYHEKSLKIAEETGDRLGESACYTNLGNSYYSLGNFRKAIEYYEKALKIAEETGDRLGESACYTNFGAAYINLGDISNYLIKPVSEYLTEGDLIYFVPYGVLHYLPLHAMEINGEPLIKTHPVAYVPSASLIKFCWNKRNGTLQSCASFGVEFEEEAEDVARFFGVKAFLGSSATKGNALKSSNKDIIHFACHGRFDALDPLSSGVKLYDGILTAREIFDTKLNTELVTLAACQTGINERNPGDELIGLARAFLYAGAPSVVVSLWDVFSPSTHELMREFYTRLRYGYDKTTALQKAQIRTMEKKEYSRPYY